MQKHTLETRAILTEGWEGLAIFFFIVIAANVTGVMSGFQNAISSVSRIEWP
jgi:hypothetical protein